MNEHEHGHGHNHHHHHHHDHNIAVGENITSAFRLGIWLNVAYVAIEAAFGFIYNSMGLLSDAGHNLSDVASLVIALIAIKAARKRPDTHFTYGYRRATVNASVVNAIILYIAVALILIESIGKIVNPVHVDGGVVAWVAGAGVIVNGLTAWLLMGGSRHDLNVKGAYLHMLADTMVSVGVVIAGIVISLTGWTLVDPLIGIAIALMIGLSSWSLLRDSLRMAFDGVPSDVDIEAVNRAIANIPFIESHHHLHVWGLSTTETAMTVHVVVSDIHDVDHAIETVRAAVEPLGISHSTIAAETSAICHCHKEC